MEKLSLVSEVCLILIGSEYCRFTSGFVLEFSCLDHFKACLNINVLDTIFGDMNFLVPTTFQRTFQWFKEKKTCLFFKKYYSKKG